jgi:hypothetical protein
MALPNRLDGGDMPGGMDTPWRVPTIPSTVARRVMPWDDPTSCFIPLPSGYRYWRISRYHLIRLSVYPFRYNKVAPNTYDQIT